MAGSRFFIARSAIFFRKELKSGLPETTRAALCALIASLNIPSNLSALSTSMERSCSPSSRAGCWLSFQVWAEVRFFEFHSTATRESFGMVSLSNSSRLPANTDEMPVYPVMFPPAGLGQRAG